METVKKNAFSLELLPFVLVLISAMLFPVVYSTVSLKEGFSIVVLLMLFYFIGKLILYKLPEKLNLPEVFTAGLSILTGAVVLFLLLPFGFLTAQVFIFALIDVLFIVYLWRTRSISLSRLSSADIIVFAVTLLHLFFNENLQELQSRYPFSRTDGLTDNFWFTAMTASLRDGDFTTSVFETGTGVYHHVLGDIPAAVLAELGNIPTHIALWGVLVPMGCFMGFYAIYVLAAWFIPELNTKPGVQLLLFAVAYLLVPINPKYLANFQPNKILWNTEAHTLPFQPTWNMVYILSALIFLYIFKGLVKSIKGIGIITLLVVLMLLAKVTSFFILGCVLGCYALYLALYKKQFKLVIALIAGAVISMLFVKFFFGNSSLKFVYQPGFLLEYLNLHSGRDGTFSFASMAYGIAIFLMLMLIWHHWRLFGMALLPKQQGLFNGKFFSLSMTMTLILCFIVTNLFRIRSFTEDGRVLIDSSFDLLQFFRSYFILLCLFGTIGIVILFLKQKSSVFYRILKLGTLSWLIFCAAVFVYIEITNDNKPKALPISWYKEVFDESKKITSGKLVAQSDSVYSAQLLSAYDIGPWHLSIRDREGGCTFSNEHLKQYDALDSLLNSASNINRDSVLRVFRQSGAQYFVASPKNISSAEGLVTVGLFIDVPESKWFFKFKE